MDWHDQDFDDDEHLDYDDVEKINKKTIEKMRQLEKQLEVLSNSERFNLICKKYILGYEKG